MGKGSKTPKAPEYDKQSRAANRAAKRSEKAAAKQDRRSDQQYSTFKKQAVKDRKVVNKTNKNLKGIATDNTKFASGLQDRYKDVYQPLEDELIQEYKDYASPERYDLNRGRAMAAVGNTYSAARQDAQRKLESYGINPAATRYAALDIGLRAQEAAAKAAAANQADLETENVKRGLRTEALKYGSQYPGWADTANDTAIVADQAQVANTLDATKTAAATQGTGTDWAAAANDTTRTGIAGTTADANIQSQGFKDQLAANQAEQESSSGWGDALGLAAGIGAKAFLGPTAPWTLAAAKGGAIPHPGAVPPSASPSGGEQTDDVNARLNAGEFVVPEDVTRWFGEKHFQNMIQKARKEKQGAGAKPSVKPAIPGPTNYASPGAIPSRAA